MVAPACILVVDDEPRSVEVIARILREEFEVLSATNVEQARALLESNWVHAIFATSVCRA